MRIPPNLQLRDPDFFHTPFDAWRELFRRSDDRQLIATAVAQANWVWSCVAQHRPIAVAQLSEEEVRRALDPDERSSVAPVRRALLDFAEQLTLAPNELSQENVRAAVAAGASVEQLRAVVEIAAQANVINRVLAARA
ncbi:MAG TPA: hypothetical protein VGF70_01615 [Solirubrobacteraceae bacterium]|jgi:alkylhydroperoxidase family enzyme